MALTIKQGDSRPYVVVALEQPAGTPIPALDTATSITMVMRTKGTTGSPKLRAACTVIDVPTATVRYKWSGTDTDTVGTYDIEFEILWGTEKQTVPTDGYYQVIIGDDLDNP